jgi:hypothetical protein
MRSTVIASWTTVIATLAVAGCGGGGGGSSADEKAAEQSARTFLAAFANGNGTVACGLVTPSGQHVLEGEVAAQAGTVGTIGCVKIIGLLAGALPASVRDALRTAQIKKVTVNGNTAKIANKDLTSTSGSLSAFLSSGGPTVLVKQNGVWKING